MEERDDGDTFDLNPLRAVLDTRVLYPPYLRDSLLLTAEHGLYRPIWSAPILEELRRNLLAFGASPAKIERTIALMGRQFPRAEHPVTQSLVDRMTNAVEDRHVAALAVSTSAAVIVTPNLRDFSPSSLARYGVVAWSPDHFLIRLYEADGATLERVFAGQAARYRTPRMSLEDLLDRLSIHAPALVSRIRTGPVNS